MKLNINTSLFLLLPLIAAPGESYTSYVKENDFLKNDTESKLLNGYCGDINKPWLQYKLFLQVDYFIDMSKKHEDVLLKSSLDLNKNLYDTYQYNIAGHSYNFYSYSIDEKDEAVYNALIQGKYKNVPLCYKYKILQFWNAYKFEDIFTTLFTEDVQEDISNEIIPEFVYNKVLIEY